jgi:hypothetical protein
VLSISRVLMRSPVAGKITFATAGARGTRGSPMPPGASAVLTRRVSLTGTSSVRISRYCRNCPAPPDLPSAPWGLACSAARLAAPRGPRPAGDDPDQGVDQRPQTGGEGAAQAGLFCRATAGQHTGRGARGAALAPDCGERPARITRRDWQTPNGSAEAECASCVLRSSHPRSSSDSRRAPGASLARLLQRCPMVWEDSSNSFAECCRWARIIRSDSTTLSAGAAPMGNE